MFGIPHQPTVRVNISLEAISVRKAGRVKASVNTRNGEHEGDLCSRGLWEGRGKRREKFFRAPQCVNHVFFFPACKLSTGRDIYLPVRYYSSRTPVANRGTFGIREK